jgi:hypothetical protein
MCKSVRDEFYKLYNTFYIDYYIWTFTFLIRCFCKFLSNYPNIPYFQLVNLNLSPIYSYSNICKREFSCLFKTDLESCYSLCYYFIHALFPCKFLCESILYEISGRYWYVFFNNYKKSIEIFERLADQKLYLHLNNCRKI